MGLVEDEGVLEVIQIAVIIQWNDPLGIVLGSSLSSLQFLLHIYPPVHKTVIELHMEKRDDSTTRNQIDDVIEMWPQ